MSKSLLLVLGGVVVLGGIAYVATAGGFQQNPDMGAPQQNEQEDAGMSQENTAEAGIFNGSLQDLLGRAGAWQCDVSVNAGGIESKGTTYVSGGKMRADFTSVIPQLGTVSNHMIVRDETTYVWTSMLKQGFKFPMQNGEIKATGAAADQAAVFGTDYDYNCKPWVSDESRFALPADISF